MTRRISIEINFYDLKEEIQEKIWDLLAEKLNKKYKTKIKRLKYTQEKVFTIAIDENYDDFIIKKIDDKIKTSKCILIL